MVQIVIIEIGFILFMAINLIANSKMPSFVTTKTHRQPRAPTYKISSCCSPAEERS